jgi:hypothetical protein
MEKGLPLRATLSEFQGDGPVRSTKPNHSNCSLRGLPLANTSRDCPDTSLQHHSRHWITSFQNIADKLRLAYILCLSKVFTHWLCLNSELSVGTAQEPARQAQVLRINQRRQAISKEGPLGQAQAAVGVRSPKTHHCRVPTRSDWPRRQC